MLFKSYLYFSILFFLLVSSCTITKRHYQEGYHVEWSHRHNRNSHAVIEKDVVEVKESNRDTLNADKSLNTGLADSELSIEVKSAEKAAIPMKSHQKGSKSVNKEAAISIWTAQMEKLQPIGELVLQPFSNSDSYDDGDGLTGIRWLDITLAILLLAFGVTLLFLANPNLGKEISALWAAITANVFVSILYFLLILLIIALIFAALEAMFGAMFPSN